MYLDMYGFTEKPFHITPNPKFIFLSKNHKEAFAHLLYGIQQRVGFMSLSGEVGTGKTTVLRTLLQQLEEADYRIALIFNPCLSALELLQTIHREFAIEFDAENSKLIDLHDSLNKFLLQQREAGKTVVLVVDEAQNLDPKVLEQLRLLSNLETETEKLIQMVLVGQPELDEILRRKDLRQLRQRLAVSYNLQPMDAEDTAAYIKHRVKIAGRSTQPLFAEPSLTAIYTMTQGTPRVINILCDRALLVAYGRDAEVVSRQDVLSAQRELRQQNDLPVVRSKIATYVALGLAAVALFAAFALLPDRPSPQADTVETTTATDLPSADQPDNTLPADKATTASVAEEIPAARRGFLLEQISVLSAEQSGLEALMAIAEAWRQPISGSVNAIRGRSRLLNNLSVLGFKVVEFQGTLSEISAMDTPLILEMSLPNIVGKRFVTVTAVQGDKFKTEPAIDESGWLSGAELKEIWFGKALLPYIDRKNVPLIDQPQVAGRAVAEVQRLLNRLPSEDIPVSSVYDRQTIESITRFQRSKGLAPDGRVGAHTLFWLYRETEEGMPRLTVGDGS